MQVLIRGGRVLDPATRTDAVLDLLVAGDRIVARGENLEPPPGADVIEAAGTVVMPGVIDMHTHSDFTIDECPQAPARLHQGVTTDVTGNCGFSPFPLEPASNHGSFFRGAPVPGHPDLESYATHLTSLEPAINIAPLVGLGTVRHSIMGGSPSRPDAAELRAMTLVVEHVLSAGAFGASSGLVYSPGRYMDSRQISAVLSPLSNTDRIYATHLRDERDGLLNSVREAIETAESARVPLEISHHKAVGKQNWGLTERTLDLVDRANERGVSRVGLDYYPFLSGSTGLASLLPAGVLEDGWPNFRAQIRDSSFRREVLHHIRTSAQFRPDEVVVGRATATPEASGRPIAKWAEEIGDSPASAILRLLEAEGENITMIVPAAAQDDLDRVAAHRTAVHGSDAWLMTKEAAVHEHPRNLTSSVRLMVDGLLGNCPMARVVTQLSSGPAARLGLADRGSLSVGCHADVTVVDPERAGPQDEHETGDTYPDLVRWVLVNGVVAMADGVVTGRRAGRVLRAS